MDSETKMQNVLMDKNVVVNEKEENISFSTEIVSSNCVRVHPQETTSSNSPEEDPLASLLDVPGEARKSVNKRKQKFSEDLLKFQYSSEVPLLQRTFVMLKENASSHGCQDELLDPLAIDPLSICTSDSLNMNIKNEEKKELNLDSCGEKAEEENMVAFPVIVPSDPCSEETPSTFQEIDPLSDVPNVHIVPKISLLMKNEPVNQISEEKEENISTFHVVVPSGLHSEESISSGPQEKDPLADISDVPITPSISVIEREEMEENVSFLDEPIESRIPTLDQEYSSFQQSEDEDPESVEIETRNEQDIPVRNEELIEEHESRTPSSSFLDTSPSVGGEEINVERQRRKSAAAALVSIQRSRVMENEESSNSSESVVSSDMEYSIESESSDSEVEEVCSKSAKQTAQTLSLPRVVSTSVITRTTLTTKTTGSYSAPVELLIFHASCACSEKRFSGGVEMEYHSSDCPHSYPETHSKTPTASQQLQSFVLLQKNSSDQQQRHFTSVLTSSDASIQKMIILTAAAKEAAAAATIPATASEIAPLQSPSSTVMSSLQASCPCSPKQFYDGVGIEFHSSGCHLSHSDDHDHQVPTASQPLQSLVPLQKNSSHQQHRHCNSGLILSDMISKQRMTAIEIAKCNASKDNASNLQVYNGKKYVSILKPLSRPNVETHITEPLKNIELDIHKMPIQINPQKYVKKALILEPADGNQLRTMLHSRRQDTTIDNFNSRSIYKSFKESCLDKLKSTTTKVNVYNLGKLIIHPLTGLLVSEISYITNNKNKSNNKNDQKGILYECLKCSQIFSSEQYQQTHHSSSSSEKHSFACHKCEMMMSQHHELAEHYRQNHNSRKQILCPVCGKVLSGKRTMKVHMLYFHSSARPHICKICSKTFKTFDCLKNHMIVHSNITPHFKCNICNASFKRKGGHRRHMKIHTGHPTVKCHLCDKVCLKDHFKRHITEVHAAERSFQCYVCDKMYVSKRRLRNHIITVHFDKDNKKHICEICGKAVSIRLLKDHMNSHSGEKSHTCYVCGKSFSTRGGIDNHLLIHNDKKYKCDICSYTCNRLDNLTTHIHSHTGVRPYKCSLCSKAFTRRDNLNTHKRLVHNIVLS